MEVRTVQYLYLAPIPFCNTRTHTIYMGNYRCKFNLMKKCQSSVDCEHLQTKIKFSGKTCFIYLLIAAAKQRK